MTTLGVTGGIGSGKTTVCRFLKDLGARVFFADDEAKRIMNDDDGARRAIREAFGAESYDAEGRLNRAHLAEQVFGDDEQVERLNRIVHPRVMAAFERAKEHAAAADERLLVHEAALLLEAGGDEHVDAVAVVDAPEEVRVRRAAQRDDADPEQVRARMGHQLPPRELRRRADYVIDNGGSLEELREQVKAVWSQVAGRRS
jgi:dephospho-CoA kinase